MPDTNEETAGPPASQPNIPLTPEAAALGQDPTLASGAPAAELRKDIADADAS